MEITEIEGKIPSITGLATTTALTSAENKIPSLSNFVKKKYYNSKIADIESRYIATDDYNKFNKTIAAERMKKKYFLRRAVLLI